MRLPSFSRTRWKRRSFSWIAENIWTGTLTSPNEIAPDQIARGTGSPPDGGMNVSYPPRGAGTRASLPCHARQAALQRADRAGAELGRGAAPGLGQGYARRERLLVGAVGGHRVPGVGQRQDAGPLADLETGEPLGIAPS